MSILNRVILAAALTWSYSVSQGLLYAACTSGRLSFSTLKLPGVIPVALIVSTAAAILLIPLAAWSMRTGTRNLWIYAPILWIVLTTYNVMATSRAPFYGLYGLLFLGIVGLVVLGFIPPAE